MKILEAKAFFDNDGLRGKAVVSYRKTLKETPGIYLDVTGEDPDKLMYTVYSYGGDNAEKSGDLYWGLTVLESVTVNGEYAMTKGHFHVDKNCAEFYFGVEGTGLLLLMDDEGNTWAEKVEPGSLHYIDGRYAHRLINTGSTQLKIGACWPTVAGHDYAAIETGGFGVRVFERDGAPVWERA